MSKQFHCKDCSNLDTLDCPYYFEAKPDDALCSCHCIDPYKAYEQGRDDAIDEMIAKLKGDWKYINKDSVVATKLIFEYMEKLQEMKENKNG